MLYRPQTVGPGCYNHSMINSNRNRARYGSLGCPFYCCRAAVTSKTLRQREKRTWRKDTTTF